MTELLTLHAENYWKNEVTNKRPTSEHSRARGSSLGQSNGLFEEKQLHGMTKEDN